MVIKNVSLDIVCGNYQQTPGHNRPEVAFAGKSNVGKSSLDQRTDESEISCQNKCAAWEKHRTI